MKSIQKIKGMPAVGGIGTRFNIFRLYLFAFLLAAATGLVFLYVSSTTAGASLMVLRQQKDQVVLYTVFNSATANPALAHYTEHLAWLNANDATRDADRHSNAWTNSYTVGYWLSGQPEDLPDLLSQLKGVFDPLALPEDFALEERDIVLREYDFRVGDNRAAQAGEAMNAFLYAGNPIAASVIGTPEDIASFTYDQAKALHAETHRPDNAVLLVTGDVTQRKLRRAMAQAGWPEGVPVADVLTPPPFALGPAASQRFTFADKDAAPKLIWRKAVALPAPIPFDLLEAHSALLSDMLQSNLPGGVAGPLRFDAALARSFDITIWPIDESSIEITFTAAPDSGVTLAALEQAFVDTFTDIAAAGLPQDSFDRVLKRFDSFWPDWDDARETDAWMVHYVKDRVSASRAPLSQRELKRLYGEMSFTTTQTLLQQLAGDGRTAVAFIGPKDSFQ